MYEFGLFLQTQLNKTEIYPFQGRFPALRNIGISENLEFPGGARAYVTLSTCSPRVVARCV